MKNRKKNAPAASKLNLLRQICNLIPEHEVSKNSQEDRSRGSLPHIQALESRCQPAPACHNGRTGKDTNAIYEITFRYKQWGIRYIKANSPAQAREKARSLTTLKGFWQDCPESFDIEEILVSSTETHCPKMPR
jgi:hypothetical protein